jgi:thiol-disulfide isomerase/thioredoxin
MLFRANTNKSVNEITSDDINKINSTERPFIIRIYSNSCGWCVKMTPEFNNFKQNKLLNNINVFDLNVNDISKIKRAFVTNDLLSKGIPQLFIIDKNGEIIKETIGFKTENDMLLFANDIITKSKNNIKQTKDNMTNKQGNYTKNKMYEGKHRNTNNKGKRGNKTHKQKRKKTKKKKKKKKEKKEKKQRKKTKK